jgi:hypothetical protein
MKKEIKMKGGVKKRGEKSIGERSDEERGAQGRRNLF